VPSERPGPSEQPAPSERPAVLLGYFDVALVVVAAPIMILIGASGAGYGIGAGAWLVLRAAGVALERSTALHRDARTEISARLGYMLSRLFLLALAVVLARTSSGRDAGLTALVVIVVAFTVQLAVSAIARPGRAA
jgi:hypothetical protein